MSERSPAVSAARALDQASLLRIAGELDEAAASDMRAAALAEYLLRRQAPWLPLRGGEIGELRGLGWTGRNLARAIVDLLDRDAVGLALAGDHLVLYGCGADPRLAAEPPQRGTVPSLAAASSAENRGLAATVAEALAEPRHPDGWPVRRCHTEQATQRSRTHHATVQSAPRRAFDEVPPRPSGGLDEAQDSHAARPAFVEDGRDGRRRSPSSHNRRARHGLGRRNAVGAADRSRSAP